jgi:ribosomal protein S18 acetylase RimI-like enzyme
LGIVKDRQGQGYGKTLIQASLARLAQRGCNRVEIGLWKDNTAALNLYRSEGFKRQQTLTYLARDLA